MTFQNNTSLLFWRWRFKMSKYFIYLVVELFALCAVYYNINIFMISCLLDVATNNWNNQYVFLNVHFENRILHVYLVFQFSFLCFVLFIFWNAYICVYSDSNNIVNYNINKFYLSVNHDSYWTHSKIYRLRIIL